MVGTASPRHHVVLRKLGVEPVAYGDGLAERVRAAAPGGIDAVLDDRGVLAVSIELAGGPDKVITIADPQAARYGARFSTGQQSVGLREVFAEIFPLVERGALQMPIERIFPLHRAADAHRLSEDGHLLGKIVLGKIVLAVPELSFIAHSTGRGRVDREGPERITATSYALDCAPEPGTRPTSPGAWAAATATWRRCRAA